MPPFGVTLCYIPNAVESRTSNSQIAPSTWHQTKRTSNMHEDFSKDASSMPNLFISEVVAGNYEGVEMWFENFEIFPASKPRCHAKMLRSYRVLPFLAKFVGCQPLPLVALADGTVPMMARTQKALQGTVSGTGCNGTNKPTSPLYLALNKHEISQKNGWKKMTNDCVPFKAANGCINSLACHPGSKLEDFPPLLLML